jgi:hypothetical protein
MASPRPAGNRYGSTSRWENSEAHGLRLLVTGVTSSGREVFAVLQPLDQADGAWRLRTAPERYDWADDPALSPEDIRARLRELPAAYVFTSREEYLLPCRW